MFKQFGRVTRSIALVAFCLIAARYAPAQTPSAAAAAAPSAEQLAAKMDEYMDAAVRVNHFSGSVLVARDGRPVFSKGYGMANRELGVTNTPQTLFRLGSITKPFTATAVMLLQERGKLSVGDSVCKYLSGCPAAWRPVTVRHLLTHTSGIKSYTDLPGYSETMALPVTHDEMLARFRDQPLGFAPGEKYEYSNSGYYLLGVVIERASGKPYADFLRESIFEPLGMTSTVYDSGRLVIRNRASGYTAMGDTFVNAAYIDMSVPFAAGALLSNVEDLLRWDQALYTEKLLSRKSLEEMLTPSKEDRGYGWAVRERLGRRVVEHDGSVNGFYASLSRFPAERVTVIVLSNHSSFSTRGIANDLTAIAFGAPYKIPAERKAIALDARTLEQYTGQYQLPSGPVINITHEGGKLMRQVGPQPKIELLAASETEFFQKMTDLQITFVKDERGRVTGYLIRRTGRAQAFAPKIK